MKLTIVEDWKYIIKDTKALNESFSCNSISSIKENIISVLKECINIIDKDDLEYDIIVEGAEKLIKRFSALKENVSEDDFNILLNKFYDFCDENSILLNI